MEVLWYTIYTFVYMSSIIGLMNSRFYAYILNCEYYNNTYHSIRKIVLISGENEGSTSQTIIIVIIIKSCIPYSAIH